MISRRVTVILMGMIPTSWVLYIVGGFAVEPFTESLVAIPLVIVSEIVLFRCHIRFRRQTK